MEEKAKLTQAEKIRISDLAGEILKHKDDPKQFDEIVSKISVFVEGVKVGIFADLSTN